MSASLFIFFIWMLAQGRDDDSASDLVALAWFISLFITFC